MTPIAADKSSMEKGQAKPQVLRHHHLKALRLPNFLSQYEQVAGVCARDGEQTDTTSAINPDTGEITSPT